jgi:hypothetical protein
MRSWRLLILHIYSTLYYSHFNCHTRTTKLSNREYTLDLDILSLKRYMIQDFVKFLTLLIHHLKSIVF